MGDEHLVGDQWSYRMFDLIFMLLLLAHRNYAQDGMGLIGDAVEAFAPCEEFVLSMNRVIGGRPQLENYWDGTFYLDKWPNLSEVRISLTVDNPAKIEFDQDVGRVLVSGRTFHISTYDKPPKIDNVKFKIRGTPNSAFPNVEKITLNGLDVCKNPKKVDMSNRTCLHKLFKSDFVQWEPIILGFGGNIGETDEGRDKIKYTCGRRLVNHVGLITNGFESKEGDWPWYATKNAKFCEECNELCISGTQPFFTLKIKKLLTNAAEVFSIQIRF